MWAFSNKPLFHCDSNFLQKMYFCLHGNNLFWQSDPAQLLFCVRSVCRRWRGCCRRGCKNSRLTGLHQSSLVKEERVGQCWHFRWIVWALGDRFPVRDFTWLCMCLFLSVYLPVCFFYFLFLGVSSRAPSLTLRSSHFVPTSFSFSLFS